MDLSSVNQDSDIELCWSDEEQIQIVIDEYNRQIEEIPVDYPEIYGMKKEKAIQMIKNLEAQRDKEVEQLEYMHSYKIHRFQRTDSVFDKDFDYNQPNITSNGGRWRYNNSMAVKNLKVPKVKNHSPHPPSIQRPKGQSLHPSRNKRNAAYRKRAKANQTNVKALFASAAVFGSLFGAAEGLYQEFKNKSESDRIVEVIKRMSEGFLNRLLIELPIRCNDYEVIFNRCETIDDRIKLFKGIYEELQIKFCYNSYDYKKDKQEMINDIIRKYHLNTDYIERARNVAYNTVAGGVTSSLTVGTTLAFREGARYAGYTAKGLKALTPSLALGASAVVDLAFAVKEYEETKDDVGLAINVASSAASLGAMAATPYALAASAIALPAASLCIVAGGVAFAVGGLTKFILNTAREMSDEEKYVNARVKSVKEAFEHMYKYYRDNGCLSKWDRCNEAYMTTDQIKLFLEDIYICDSEDIIHLEENYLYPWEFIKKAVREYERKELENSKEFKDELEEEIFILCSLLSRNNLRLFLYDWDVDYPGELSGKLLYRKCSHDVRKRITYFSKHPEILEDYPASKIERMMSDLDFSTKRKEKKEINIVYASLKTREYYYIRI